MDVGGSIFALFKGQWTMMHRWFQFHLSTAVVLMFVAGGIMWANMHVRMTGEMWKGEWIPYPGFGWPAVSVRQITSGDRPIGVETDDLLSRYAFIDLAVALAILFTVWFLCEWLIRLRAAKKGA